MGSQSLTLALRPIDLFQYGVCAELIRKRAPVISVSGPPSSYQINVKQVFFEMRYICPGGGQCHFAVTKLEDIHFQKRERQVYLQLDELD